MASEIIKAHVNTGKRPQLYYFRDQQGLEVEFVFLGRGGRLILVEVKASRTVSPRMARPMLSLADAWRNKGAGAPVEMFIVHEGRRLASYSAVAPGVRALPWQEFVGGELSNLL